MLSLAFFISLLLGTAVPLPTGAVPSISNAELGTLIEQNLAANGPMLTVLFGRRVGEHLPSSYVDLARIGFLEQVHVNVSSGCMLGPAYRLTDKGRAEAVARGWHVSEFAMIVPLGKFQYLAHSAIVQPSGMFKGDKNAFDIVFKYRFVGNANAKYLLGFVPRADWPVSTYYSYPSPTLGQIGQTSCMKLLLFRSRGVWNVSKMPYYEAPACGMP